MRSQLFDQKIVGNAEEALDLIGNVLESSTEYSIIGKDLDGKILLWNEGARRLYGYEPEEVVGKANSAILYTPEDVQAGKPREVRAAALRDGKWEGTIQRVRKDGRQFAAREVITPRRDALGHAIGFLLISKDISEEIQLTEQLKATQFYTRSLIESNIDALMTTDPLGLITDVNQQMEALTGYTRDELIGSPFKTYFTDPQRAEEGIRLVLREGKVTNYELTAHSKDQRVTVVSYNASTFRDAAGKLQGVFAAARDITEQKQLERKLRDSEAYNRGLIEASVDGLVTVDPSGTITDVNKQMSRMSGYPREELIGTPFADYFVDSDRALAGVNETFEKGIVTDYVLNLATRDARRFQVSFNASIFRDPSGSVRGIFASAHDITEQARLQAQLAEERAYNRGLIEASVDGLVTVDESMTITDVNETICKMAGRPRNQLLGSEFPSYFVERDRAAEGVRLTFKEGEVTNYVLTLQSADGNQMPVSFNAAVFKDTIGVVRGIFASARDITAQKNLEQQLRAQQFYTRSLIESNIDALMTTDPLGLITDVNQQMEKLTGWSRDELIGSPFKTYFTDPQRAEEGIRLVLREGKVTDYELTARSRDGNETVVSYNAVTFSDASGNLQGVFAAARDITERKQVEEVLRRNTEELARSNLDLEQFAYVASHDLQEPLRAVGGCVQVLQKRYKGQLDGRANELIAHTIDGVSRMQGHIHDLLEYSRVSTRGKAFEPTDCQAALDLALANLEAAVQETGAVVTHDALPVVRADSAQLAQLLQNLLSNAIKFRGQQPPRIHVGVRDAGHWVFSVKDNGIGIQPEYFDRIFVLFQRLHTRDEYPGTGIGLALCKKIVERHGGRIWLESEPGKGSTFYFTILK